MNHQLDGSTRREKCEEEKALLLGAADDETGLACLIYADWLAERGLTDDEKCWRDTGEMRQRCHYAVYPCPPCRVCGKKDEVICYPDDHSQTVCPECCDKAEEHPDGEKGHQFYYDRWEGHLCRYCGIPRNCTDYEEDWEP
jgi:hypothetical protein